MRRYETLMVLHPELPDAQTRETVDRARRLITEMGGEVHQMHEWGMRELAYPIRKLTRGYYVLFEYSAGPEVVRELERTFKIADEFLRYVTVASSGVRREQRPARAPGREEGAGEEPRPSAEEDRRVQ